MFELVASHEFSSAHVLNGYEGDCSRLHGHNFTVEACVRSPRLGPIGMSIDFKKLKGAMREIIARWDHVFLNELEDFRGLNPTAEVIAQVLFQKLDTLLQADLAVVGGKLYSVRVWETARCSATYYGDL